MRKIACMVFAMLLCANCALADGYDAVDSVKTALTLMSYGEYDEAAQAIGLAGEGENLSTLAAEQLPELASVSVQTDYAVAWLTEETWYVAVPVVEPDNDYVSCFVVYFDTEFVAKDYCAATVCAVLEKVENAEKVVWDVEYEAGSLVLIPDKE